METVRTINKEATELVKRHDVKGTPFVIVEMTEQEEIFGTLGKYRVTDKKEAVHMDGMQEELKEFDWNRLIQVITVLLAEQDNMKEIIKQEIK